MTDSTLPQNGAVGEPVKPRAAGHVTSREWAWAAGWAAVLMAATCIPYLLAWDFTPRDGVFPGILFNADDHGVYFSWMRQALDGRFVFRNLFTGAEQLGLFFHPYFLLLGLLAKGLALPIPVAYHMGRVLSGVGALLLVYRLAAHFTPDRFARRLVFWTTALSGGLGWLAWSDRLSPALPADQWQAELLTFSSLYTNGLFSVALCLMLGVVLCLLQAEQVGDGRAVGAGLCGLLLGLVHSYDVIHLAVAWGLYLAARGVAERKVPVRLLRQAAIAAAVAVPAVAYMGWYYRAEPVFRLRADTPTLSPPLWSYAVGLGLLLPLGAVGMRLLARSGRGDAWLPAAWTAGGFIAAYLPFAFQRKMIMGVHLPLSLAAGLAIAAGAAAVARRIRRERLAPAMAAVAVGLLAPTSVLYPVRDLRTALATNLTSTGVHPVWWPAEEVSAMDAYGRLAGPDGLLLCWPLHGVLVPGRSGRAVWAGHWAESVRFPEAVRRARAFFAGRMTSAERRRFLEEERITHVLLGPEERLLADREPARAAPPLPLEPFLEPVYEDGETRLFRVTR